MDKLPIAILVFLFFTSYLFSQELTENNASEWGVFDENGLVNNLSDNTVFVQQGNSSIEFNTTSGSETGLFYPEGRDANFNLSGKTIKFNLYAINTSIIGFQQNLTVRLYTTETDYFEYQLPSKIGVDQWILYSFPLSADDPCGIWLRDQVGSPSLNSISTVEFRFDTWDFGFDLYLDGLEFVDAPIVDPTIVTQQNDYIELQNLMVVFRSHKGLTLTDPLSDIQDVANEVTNFFWRHSKQSLHIKWEFLEIQEDVDVFRPGINAVASPVLDALLRSKGLVNDQYDAVLGVGIGFGNFGWTGGGYQLLGKAGFGQSGWYTEFFDNVWTFVHEFNHTLDGLMLSAGLSLFPHNHPGVALANGEFVPVAGPNFDLNAKLLQSLSKDEWFNLVNCGPLGQWGTAKQFADADGDGFADNDPSLPLDELRFGSNPGLVDTDNDDLSDLEESYAGVFQSADPGVCDSDGDAFRDGLDPEVLYNLDSDIRYRSIIPGSSNLADYFLLGTQDGVNLHANFDENYLFFAINNIPYPGENFRVSFDLQGDGLFYGDDNITLNFNNDALVSADLHDESTIPIVNTIPTNLFTTAFANGGTRVFIAIPESVVYSYVSSEGTEIGIRVVGPSGYESNLFDLDDYSSFSLCGSDAGGNFACNLNNARCPFITCPTSSFITCGDEAVPGVVMIDTLCSQDQHFIEILGPDIDGPIDCPGTTYSYTFIVSDMCDNIDTCLQVFTIDNEGPEISNCPNNRLVTCASEIVPDIPDFTVSCGVGDIDMSGPVIVGDPNCLGTTYTYTCTVSDACGRSTSCVQIFTILANEDPVISFCPVDQTVDCSSNIVTGTPIFDTTCGIGGDFTVDLVDFSGIADCPATVYTYEYTVTDACNRSSTCLQKFTIEPGPDPMISFCPVNQAVNCSADIVTGTPLFNTSCGVGGDFTVDLIDVSGIEDCPATMYTYEYTVTDGCNRSSSCVQVFTIDIGVDPTITFCPTNQTVNCSADIVTGTPLFNTSCGVGGDFTVDLIDVSGIEDCPATMYIYDYTVTDACSRSANCIQTFTIDIGVDPTITFCPTNQTVNCSADIVTGIPLFNTSCGVGGDFAVDLMNISGIDDCPATIYTYQYTVTDGCNRSSTCLQEFTIDVGSDPMITSCPTNQTVACSTNIVTGTPLFQTSCGVGADFSVDLINTSGTPDCPGTIYTYEYTVSDACDRTSTCKQEFTIDIGAIPVIDSCPIDQTVTCKENIVTGTPGFTTSCGVGGSFIVELFSVAGDENCPGTVYTYLYTVTDACDRSSTCTQDFTIGVGANPTITECPADQIVNCMSDIMTGTPLFDTTCGVGGDFTVDFLSEDGIENCPATEYTYLYTVTDACNRSSTCEQVFTIDFGSEPEFTSCGLLETVSCPEDIVIAPILFSTSCGVGATIDTSLFIMTSNGSVSCPGAIYEYTFTVTDDCGRINICVQVFFIDDGLDPMITSCPGNQEVDCIDDILLGDPGVATFCGVGFEVAIDTLNPLDVTACPGDMFAFEYLITDDCGRENSCTQTFTISGGDPPMITSCPIDQLVACQADIILGVPEYTTFCGVDATIDTIFPGGGLAPCPGVMYTYEYIVTDNCNRSTNCFQTFTIGDGADPVITSCPAAMMVDCPNDIVLGVPEYVASCGLVGGITIDGPDISGDPGCPGTTYSYTYIVTDDCNRSATCAQLFTISDGEGPIIDCPENILVSCESEIIVPLVTFTASCEQDATVTKSGPVVNGDPACDGTTYTYTHTVTDGCGRTSVCEQVFTIDNTCQRLDFDAYPAGTIISNQYPGVHISTQDNHNKPAMIFDTGNPTGNDFDIGTPNEKYGGPGTGPGFCNDEFQGNALIISKDRDIPNETEGQLIFNFDCAVLIRSIDFIDMECGHNTISLYDLDHQLITQIEIPQFGENSFHVETIDIGGVYKMIIDLPCAGGAISDLKYCEDMMPGSMCGLCEEATLDFSDEGIHWQNDDMQASYQVGYQTIDIGVSDPDNIFEDSGENMSGIEIGIEPNDVDDVLEIGYTLSEVANNVIFDIVDLDYKDSASKQQEKVCVCGFLEGDPTPIYPSIISLDGSVLVEANCATATTNSAVSNQDESVLVNFKECIDEIVIKYGTGPDVPTDNPSYSKIIVGKNYGFTTETCPGVCEPCGLIGDQDGDGVCDDCDICQTGDDGLDSDGDGIPDACDSDCEDSALEGDDDQDGVCNVDDVCPGGNDNLDVDGNGIPDECEICHEYKLVFGCTNEWMYNSISGSYTVLSQEFDINIMDMDNILVDTNQDGFGLNVGIDPDDNDEVLLIKYNLSEVASSVMFDIVDLDYKDGGSKQQEAVCVYGFLDTSMVQILPVINSLEGSVSIDGNCAEGTVNSTQSGEDESIMVMFNECIDQIVIEYGTGTNSPTNNPDYSNITIGLDLGFKTIVCENECDTCEDTMMLVGEATEVHYQVSMSIESNQRVQGGDVIYDAGDNIVLLPDFEVMQGASFNAFIEGCEN